MTTNCRHRHTRPANRSPNIRKGRTMVGATPGAPPGPSPRRRCAADRRIRDSPETVAARRSERRRAACRKPLDSIFSSAECRSSSQRIGSTSSTSMSSMRMRLRSTSSTGRSRSSSRIMPRSLPFPSVTMASEVFSRRSKTSPTYRFSRTSTVKSFRCAGEWNLFCTWSS